MIPAERYVAGWLRPMTPAELRDRATAYARDGVTR
jgi:hypothetical protein